ncbi:MAG: M48 family metallopeptidase [Hydrogenoanaerobacterium sp.]
MTEYLLIRARRKSISLSIDKTLQAVVRAPLKMPLCNIEAFVVQHADWIVKHKELRRLRQISDKAAACDKAVFLKKAAELLPARVKYYSEVMGVAPTGVKLTSAATRWGSCSGKDSLCFSYRLMLLPSDIIDYIVVHELAHIRVKNHSALFYAEIERFMPDYKERVARLKAIQNGNLYDLK